MKLKLYRMCGPAGCMLAAYKGHKFIIGLRRHPKSTPRWMLHGITPRDRRDMRIALAETFNTPYFV